MRGPLLSRGDGSVYRGHLAWHQRRWRIFDIPVAAILILKIAPAQQHAEGGQATDVDDVSVDIVTL